MSRFKIFLVFRWQDRVTKPEDERQIVYGKERRKPCGWWRRTSKVCWQLICMCTQRKRRWHNFLVTHLVSQNVYPLFRPMTHILPLPKTQTLIGFKFGPHSLLLKSIDRPINLVKCKNTSPIEFPSLLQNGFFLIFWKFYTFFLQ